MACSPMRPKEVPMKIYLGIVLFGLTTAACGGGDSGSDSGIDQSKNVTSLSASEVQTFCKWALAEQGGPGHEMMCGAGSSATVETQANCETRYGHFTSTCTATVGDAEDCVRAIAADLCALVPEGNACQPLFACLTGKVSLCLLSDSVPDPTRSRAPSSRIARIISQRPTRSP
jgi:hypothetical protein